MGVVEGAKTAPPAPGTKSDMNNQSNRLVLGEPEAAAQEARDHGGVFIDPNPQVLKTLQQSGIDPYMIYEQALKQQIEARIERIDFVNANVDELYKKWVSQPPASIPIPVRLILWLKNNADNHGYRQDGDSWVRK
jgi:hypothetical protein